MTDTECRTYCEDTYLHAVVHSDYWTQLDQLALRDGGPPGRATHGVYHRGTLTWSGTEEQAGRWLSNHLQQGWQYAKESGWDIRPLDDQQQGVSD